MMQLENKGKEIYLNPATVVMVDDVPSDELEHCRVTLTDGQHIDLGIPANEFVQRWKQAMHALKSY